MMSTAFVPMVPNFLAVLIAGQGNKAKKNKGVM
jgi:hypothetical protein